jgi:hypothetical protein
MNNARGYLVEYLVAKAIGDNAPILSRPVENAPLRAGRKCTPRQKRAGEGAG